MGFVLACAAIATVAALVVVWMRMINRVAIAEGRWIVNSMVAVASLLGLVALTQAPGTFGGILAGLSVTVGVVYAVDSSLRGQSAQLPAVAVGQPLPDFTAPDENGDLFSLSSLHGKPVLLKFFRGHW